MPLRWPAWTHAVVLGAGWSTLMLVLTSPTLQVPWSGRIIFCACSGVVFGVFTAVGIAAGQQRAYGGRLTAAQRARVDAIVRGRESADDPHLSRAAFCLAREWTSWRGNTVMLGLLTAVGLAASVAAAITLAPEFWVSTGVLAVAGAWGLWLTARNRAAGNLFLATSSAPSAQLATQLAEYQFVTLAPGSRSPRPRHR